MKLSAIVLLLLAFFAFQSHGSTMYGIVTEFSGSETVLWNVKIDTSSGAVTNVSEALVYAGGSATVDGISAFDQTNGIYYWATDAESSFVYSVNVDTKQLLAPLDLGATAILRLNYDASKQRLLILYYIQGKGVFMASSVPGAVTTLFQLPSTINSGYVMTSSVDESKQQYHLIVDVGMTVKYEVATFDLNSGALLSQVPLDNSTCGQFYPQFFTFNAATNSLVGGAEEYAQNRLSYYYTSINPRTGLCKKTSIPAPNGIVTCWTYDAHANLLWFAEATNTGALLFSYDTSAGKLSQPVLVKDYVVPESIEVSYN